MKQSVIFIEAARKRALLADLFADSKLDRAIVFTRTKRGADRVAKYLEGAGVSAAAIHGDKTQGQRERALASFKAGQCRALVATDIAARGIDIDSVSHVVNFELPNVPEAYVHRIGRTARAGATGEAITLCADDERTLLRDIQKLTRQTIPTFDRRNDRALGAMVAVEAQLEGERRPQRQEHKPQQNRGGASEQQNRNRRRGRPAGGGGGGGGQKRHGASNNQRAVTSGSWSPVGA